MGHVTIVSLTTDKELLKIFKWKKWFSQSFYYSCLLKKIPFKIQECTCYGEVCRHLFLPFDLNTLEECKQEYIIHFITELFQREEIEFPYFSMELNSYKQYFCRNNSWILAYIMFPEIYQHVLKQENFFVQELHPLVLDSEDRKVEYILEYILPSLNHLAIRTKRGSYFDNFVEAVYETYGLVVEILEGEEIQNNISLEKFNLVIDFNKEFYREYRFYKLNTVILDFDKGIEKEQYFLNRRKDLRRFDSFVINIKGEAVEPELAAAILLSQNWKLNQFIKNRCGLSYEEDGKYLIERYGMKVNYSSIPFLAKTP